MGKQRAARYLPTASSHGPVDVIDFVGGIVKAFALGAIVCAVGCLRGLQTGRVQNYVYGILGGVAFFAIIQYLLQ